MSLEGRREGGKKREGRCQLDVGGVMGLLREEGVSLTLQLSPQEYNKLAEKSALGISLAPWDTGDQSPYRAGMPMPQEHKGPGI